MGSRGSFSFNAILKLSIKCILPSQSLVASTEIVRLSQRALAARMIKCVFSESITQTDAKFGRKFTLYHDIFIILFFSNKLQLCFNEYPELPLTQHLMGGGAEGLLKSPQEPPSKYSQLHNYVHSVVTAAGSTYKDRIEILNTYLDFRDFFNLL